MQNSDEYLQHPGIGTTQEENPHTLPTHPNPQVQSFSKCSPNKLFWLLLPGNNPTAVFSPSACKSVGVLSALERTVRMAAEMESEMWGGSKSGSEVQMAVTPKSIWSTIYVIFPHCVPVLDVHLANEPANQTSGTTDLGSFEVRWISPSVYCLNEVGHYLDFWESQKL